MSTSEEEIQRQHAEAVSMSRTQPCEPYVDRGEIPLEWKQCPTVDDVNFQQLYTSDCCLDENTDETSSSSCSSSSSSFHTPELRAEDPIQNELDYEHIQKKFVDENINIIRLPTIKNDHNTKYTKGSCISSRGIVNIQPLANILFEGVHDPPSESISSLPNSKLKKMSISNVQNLWDIVNAAQNNVNIMRPSHDGWNIKKIILIFCDDFLQRIYHLPWWWNSSGSSSTTNNGITESSDHYDPRLREAVQPILDTLNITQDRIVRLLFAALPPGRTIPIHHDSGEWVKHTHRVHVPIIVPSSDPNTILFRCGPTPTSLERVSCQPGHVFEMNNQAKHAVSNCHPTEYRVHLIMDYVDADFYGDGMNSNGRSRSIPKRIQLQRGEIMMQTRRSIDRYVDKDTRPSPSYFILGAQKSGTTSLYEYMNQHPLLIKPKRRETHCLDWRWGDSDETTNTKLCLDTNSPALVKWTKEKRKHCDQFFYTEELRYHPSCMTGESTPSYLLDSYRVIPRLKQVYPHWKHVDQMKFIVMVRDPVKRARSHYAMVTSLDGTKEQIKHRGTEWLELSFEQVIDTEMKRMKEVGLIPYWDMEHQCIDYEIFNSFVGSEEEDDAYMMFLKTKVPMMSGSHSLLLRGMYELQLRQWFKAFSENTEEQFLILKLEDLEAKDVLDEKGVSSVQKMMGKVWTHLKLPYHEVKDESPKNTRTYKETTGETEMLLQKFYQPHNRRLEGLLGSDWNDTWSYK